MTAVVAVLNKHAVAIAADSAVTITGARRKINNKALKIFTLSKYEPVGVMIYNNASFMLTPWEIVIKMYRKKLEKTPKDTLVGYQEDFIRYLKDMNFFSDDASQALNIENAFRNLLRMIVQDVSKNKFKSQPITAASSAQYLDEIKLKFQEILRMHQGSERSDEFVDYTIDEFRTFASAPLDIALDKEFKAVIVFDDATKSLMSDCAYWIFLGKSNIQHSGLVFVGYGDKEIYPSLIAVDIDFAIGNRLKFQIDERTTITHTMTGAISPFAQDDVMNTILQGVDPRLEDAFYTHLKQLFEKYNQSLVDIIRPGNGPLADRISTLDVDSIVEQYKTRIFAVKKSVHLEPLLAAVSTLAKEDLGEMAESLIYLTYLKKHITNAEESVGGPVDVAIISKGDGFIWLKRKHYFKPDLNETFIQRYLTT